MTLQCIMVSVSFLTPNQANHSCISKVYRTCISELSSPLKTKKKIYKCSLKHYIKVKHSWEKPLFPEKCLENDKISNFVDIYQVMMLENPARLSSITIFFHLNIFKKARKSPFRFQNCKTGVYCALLQS